MSRLYVTSTPVGNLEDITLRAITVLKPTDALRLGSVRVTIERPPCMPPGASACGRDVRLGDACGCTRRPAGPRTVGRVHLPAAERYGGVDVVVPVVTGSGPADVLVLHLWGITSIARWNCVRNSTTG